MARRVAREEYEQLCWMIKKWNHNRLELFEITMPNENLEFEGVMRFYFQSTTEEEAQQKVATKCIRVANTASTESVVEALVQKFRPDLRMLTSQSSYALYEVHSNEEERRMEPDEYPLMVQLGWVNGEREGRFLLRRGEEGGGGRGGGDGRNKRVSRRGKKIKREWEGGVEDAEGRGEIARSLYNIMPESKFTRSISKKNERNGHLHASRDILDDNSTLRVYADSLLPNGPCKSLLIAGHDTSAQVVKSSLEKYGIPDDPNEFCLVQLVIPTGQAGGSNPQLNVDYTEHILGDNDRPLHFGSQWTKGGKGETVQFHLRRKDSFICRPHSSSHSRSRSQSPDEVDDPTLPALVEIFLDQQNPQRPRRFLLSAESTEIGSNPAFAVGNLDPRGHLCLNTTSIKPRHCIFKGDGSTFTIAPLDKSAVVFVNSIQVHGSQVLEHNSVVRLGDYKLFRFFAPIRPPAATAGNGVTSWQNSSHDSYESSRGNVSRAKSVENIRNSHVDELHQVMSSRRLREKAFSEYDLQAQRVVEEEEGEREGEEGRERKRSDPHGHSVLEERQYATPRKRHPSAPQCSFNPPTTSAANGPLPLPETDRVWTTPLSLSFLQTKQQLLLKKLVAEVDSYQLQFKLGPAYGLYMVAKHLYGAEFQVGSSASEQRKTVVTGLKTICSHLKRAIKESRSDAGALAFWLANTAELLHFLRQDYQLGAISNDYDISFTHSIHLVYKYFVTCMIKELHVFLPAFYDDSNEADQEDAALGGYTSGPEAVLNRVGGMEPDVIPTSRSKVSRHSSLSGTYYSVSGSKVSRRGRSTIHDVLQTLNSTITLLKRCRVNAQLSIMIFSNLFRYISIRVFNRLVGGEVRNCGRSLGQRLCKRLGKVKNWAEREGMELPAHTHLTMIIEAANLLQASKKHADSAHSIYSTCPHLNSLQVSTLLEFCVATDGEAAVNKSLVDGIVHLARGRDDTLRGEGLEVRAEEDLHPELLFHIPREGYSSETITGVPGGLQEFLQPMISAGLCKLTVEKESSGMWSPPVRNVNSSQSMDHSISPQHSESPHNFNTLPKTASRSRKSSVESELRHNTLPRHGDQPGFKVVKVTISKENNTLGISIVAAKLTANAHFSGETGVFIRSLIDGGPAKSDGRLRRGDQILEVDGTDLTGYSQDRATQVLRNSGKKVTLLVAKQAAQYYGLSQIIQQSSPRYNRNTDHEGSSHAKKAARRLKREQKERQRQERYTTEFRLERKQLDHHRAAQSPIQQSSAMDPRFPNPQITKWVMEQNALYNSEKGSEAEGPGSASSMSNIADQDGHTSSPVPSFATSSSHHTKSSYERRLHRTGSPPVRDSSSRMRDGHATSPFDTLESLEVQNMSDSASKLSDYSAEPEYNVPQPKSAPPVSMLPQISYKDAFNSSSLCSQQMSNSLTPYSQQHGPSQQGHLDKLSMDVLYHTPQSGASLSGISAIIPRMLHGRGGKPYLGRVHLKELDGDEIDLEKQRIKLMFYEKKNEERSLQEEDEVSSQPQETSPDSTRKAYRSSPPLPPPPTNFDEGLNRFSENHANVRDIVQELQTLERLAVEQRRRCKELKYTREKESLDLKKAELEFQEQELLEPASPEAADQERWQKEQKKRLRQLSRYSTEQKEKIQQIETEELRAKAKLKTLEANIFDLNQELEAMGTRSSSSAAIVESHLQPSYHSNVSVPSQHPERNFGRTSSGCSPPGFANELQQKRDGQMFRPNVDSDQAMAPEREWPQDTVMMHPKPSTVASHFRSMESINSSSLVGVNEPVPEFSREIVNTISESTNMTEPTQEDPIPASSWVSKYSDDPYAAEFAKYSYSDEEFFMDSRRMRFEEAPLGAHHPYEPTSDRDVPRSPYPIDPHSPMLPNGHAPIFYTHPGINCAGAPIDHPPDEERDSVTVRPQWGDAQRKTTRLPPPPVSEKPQTSTSGRTGHHYSRSNRPRLHGRHQQLYLNDNVSTVSGVSTTSSYTANSDFLNGDDSKPRPSNVPAPDIIPGTHPFYPSSSKVASPTFMKHLAQPMADYTSAAHSPSYPAQTSHSPYRENPLPSSPAPQQHLYSVPTTTSSPTNTAVYDIPRKTLNNPATTTAIYDQPRPATSSPQNHTTSNTTSPQPPSSSSSSSSYNAPYDSNKRSPFHKPQERITFGHNSHEQHYDVPKPQALEQVRPLSDRDVARQTMTNTSPHPYQYHGLPTKPPAPRSYSRGRQDAMGHSSGFRGQVSRPTHPQRVQRQQTEL